MDADPAESPGPWSQKCPVIGLVVCCHQLEILNHFLKQGAFHFHFALVTPPPYTHTHTHTHTHIHTNYVAIPEGGIDFLKTKSSLFLERGEGQTHRDCFSQPDSLFLEDWLVQASDRKR